MPRTTVHQGANGQFKTTIPKAIGQAMDLDGEKVEWEVSSGKSLKMTVVSDSKTPE